LNSILRRKKEKGEKYPRCVYRWTGGFESRMLKRRGERRNTSSHPPSSLLNSS